MTDTAQGVWVKFARADRHYSELQATVKEYLEQDPFKTYQEEEPETGALLTKVKVVTQPPVELAAVLGDVFHNARSALDHLACHLVARDGGTPDKGTYFPTGKSKSEFSKAVKEKLKGAAESTKEKVRALAVHPGGDEDLWQLHQLDIEDKHKLLIAVGMSYHSFTLQPTIMFQGDEVTFPPIALAPADKMYPLQDGDIIFRIERPEDRWSSTEGDPVPHREDFGFTFLLGFVSGTAVDAQDVLEVTKRLLQHAKHVAQDLLT